MKRLILTTVGIALILNTPLSAQQANQNIPVLPVVAPQDASDTEWYTLGDGFLQRQVEPTIAVSTRNPEHVIAFFNDYRAVDIPDDAGLGEERQTAAIGLNVTNFMLAGLFPDFRVPYVAPQPIAAAEAWVGGSRSYDGGLTWSGLFMPGAMFDYSPASFASPVYGLEAATDPVAVAGPCGYVYVVFVAFTRGGASKLVVARFQDLNNDEGGDTWTYQGMTVVETGNNATWGHFLDKPHIGIDVVRNELAKKKPKGPPGGGGDDQCAQRVYVSYSTFTGKPKPGKFQSKLNFAVSSDYGESFSTSKINKNFGQNQGSFIAVDPRTGTPDTTGGGTVYVFWRHFNSPDSIIMTKSTDFGSGWSKPKEIIGPTPMAVFDQPTITTEYGDPSLLTFRSNAFPTAAVTGDGTVFAAWQERVDESGQPDPAGSPRIVMMRSTDGGTNWTDVYGEANSRTAVDFGDRDAFTVPPPGFGALPDSRPSGPQVMPWLSYGGGRLALAYYESRGLLGGVDGIGIQDEDLSGFGFISGIDRVVDFRAALLDPATGQLDGTTQVSRYPVSAAADLSDGEQVADIAAVLPEACDDGFGVPETCQPSLNFMNKPQSGSGGSPFMGDYPGMTPTLQFVYDESQGGWRWATEAGDVPYRAFHTVFSDNRHLIPPTYPGLGEEEWERYHYYGPPGIGGACVNPGSRNTDVLTARLNAELIVSAPTTYKQLDARRGFPIRVQNGTGVDRFYRLTITQGADSSSFSTEDADLDSGDIQVFPYSSVSQVVYVEAGAAGPIRVDVVEIDAIEGIPNGGEAGNVTFNPDPGNPMVEGLGATEVQDPFVRNPFVRNPFVRNPFVRNDGASNLSVSNPFVRNPFVRNPFVRNSAPGGEPDPIYDIVDTTWEVGADAGTNTAANYIPVINIDNAGKFVGNYAFQLIVYKTSEFAGYNEACEAYNLSQDQILSNVVQDPNDPNNPFVRNPSVLNPFVRNEDPENPFVRNPFVRNPFVLNSAYTVAPSDSTATSAKALEIADDGTLRAPRAPEVIKMTLRAFRLKPFCGEVDPDPEDCIQPGTDLVFNPEEDAPSAAVGSGPCLDKALAANDPAAAALCFDYYAPDLVPELREPENNTDLQATAGGTLQFPIGGFDVVNQGTADATAENRPLRHGFYLTTDPTVEFDSDGIPTNAYRLGGAVSGPPGTTIPVGGRSEFDDPVMLTFPLNLTAGEYNLILYVDDYEEVSEFDEVNNKLTTVVPITVVTPVELLGNGSFEQPHLPSGWALFANGEVPGGWSFEWTACGDDCPVDPLLEIQTSGVAVAARDGSQYAELDSDGAPDRKANLRLYQDIDTCEGATYTLHYSWAKRTSDDLLDVSWGGDLKATNGDDAAIKQWHDETLQLLGDGTTLQLEFEEVGPPDTLGMLLDAVSLVGPECPPEVIGK